MKNILKLMFVFFTICNVSAQTFNSLQETKINKIIAKMTIEEKIGQLSQPVLNEIDAELDKKIKEGKIGSFCSFSKKYYTPEEHNRLQRIAMNETRLGIPILFTYDVIHGFSTVYPIPLAIAATWNLEMARKGAQIAANESRHYGIDMTFSPMVDVSRDPRWGRISECYGEDVRMNMLFGGATVDGYQGESLKEKNTIASCIKHFVGYGLSQGGRDKQFTEISRNSLLNTYLPPFKTCIDKGAVSVMTAFNDISGVPASANQFTIHEILKKQWGFKGFVLSDWDAIVELKNHGIAADDEDAAVCAINAGVDMEMKSNTYETLVKAVKDKRVSINTINDAVRRILRIKFKLGLFDNPYIDVSNAITSQLTPSNRKISRNIASESMVLLKNDGVLPLSKNIKYLRLEGPFADSQDMLGWWTGNGKYKDVVTVKEGIKNNNPQIEIVTGARDPNSPLILCLGEAGNRFGETNCVDNIELDKSQVEMVREAKSKGKKVVVIIFNGRPLALSNIEKYADAILISWHPGSEAGNAVSDILFGDVNPSGKLPCSFPKSTGQIPIYYSDRLSGRSRANHYLDIDAKPLYPFGYGLSYTSFSINDLLFKSKNISSKVNLEFSVKVTNTGNSDGQEVLQIYVHDKKASITRPKKELIAFKKIFLKASESKIVDFSINVDEFSFFNVENKRVIEPGDYDIWVGNSSENGLHSNFAIK